MQRSSSTANHDHRGGYFSIFGRSKTPTTSTHPPRTPPRESQREKQGRPSTSSAHAQSESAQSSSASRSPFSESRNTSFSSNASIPTKSPPNFIRRVRSNSIGQSNHERERRAEEKEPVKPHGLIRQSSRNFGNPFANTIIGDAVRIAPRRLNSIPSESSKSPGTRERESAKPPSAHQNTKKVENPPPPVSAYVAETERVVASKRDSVSSIAPYEDMLARPGTGYSAGPSSNGVGGGFNTSFPPQSPTLETITYQHIQETSSKRISTLDYLRKAYVAPIFLHFDLSSSLGQIYEAWTDEK